MKRTKKNVRKEKKYKGKEKVKEEEEDIDFTESKTVVSSLVSFN